MLRIPPRCLSPAVMTEPAQRTWVRERLPWKRIVKLEFFNMANIGGPMHLQEPKSGPTGYPLQPRSPLGILVSSQASTCNLNKCIISRRFTVHVARYSYKFLRLMSKCY